MGLDGAGMVEEADASDTRFPQGGEVVLHPGLSCGRCEFCRRGDTVLCMSARCLGEHRDGPLAQYVSLPAQNVFPKPEALDFAQAAALGVNYQIGIASCRERGGNYG